MSSWMRSSGPSATEVMRAPRCSKTDSGRRVAEQAGTLHHGAISLGMQQWLVKQLRKRVQLKPGDVGTLQVSLRGTRRSQVAQYRRHDTRSADPTKSWDTAGLRKATGHMQRLMRISRIGTAAPRCGLNELLDSLTS